MPDVQTMIRALEAEANRLADSRIIKTEEARHIVTLIQRLIETLVSGEPKTKYPSQHHT